MHVPGVTNTSDRYTESRQAIPGQRRTKAPVANRVNIASGAQNTVHRNQTASASQASTTGKKTGPLMMKALRGLKTFRKWNEKSLFTTINYYEFYIASFTTTTTTTTISCCFSYNSLFFSTSTITNDNVDTNVKTCSPSLSLLLSTFYPILSFNFLCNFSNYFRHRGHNHLFWCKLRFNIFSIFCFVLAKHKINICTVYGC